ncbi:Pimeloyl-ACP methyl ester carboxylesterase [Xaviernesmea oryzae]|uniref:Pimeloyl-ACP methyl ester carboxylesterase n=1 Tax=Xaviernesmea oryzae TaxID=464029 RepID=A0A1X7G1X4_9HYPH|nr:alpha/beta hydrolase [Xaviernesmea oryzae]SMF62370.1 Pimeloyl-ACP methyl ester carboxylesterase [Xaviernesmea oryzae]
MVNLNAPASAAASHASAFPPKTFIDVKGIRTAYHDLGQGPETIVFIYGGNFGGSDASSSAAVWSINAVPLSQRFRVIVPDKLGQGYTGVPLRDEHYTMSAVVAHVADFIRAMNLPPVHIVGHSRGGFASARVAMQFPELVRSLTIVSSGTLSPGVGTNEVTLASPPFQPGTRECARWVYENYCYKPDVVTEEWIDIVMDVLAQPEYQKGVAKMVGEKLSTRLFLPDLARYKRETLAWINDGRLQRPSQIVWGFNDRTVVAERGVEMFNMVSAHERRTTLNLVNEAGHFVYREHPERFNELLANFVNLYSARG